MSTLELLERHKPHLVYDRQEQFFADSAAEMTDAPGMSLYRADRKTIVAHSDEGKGPALLRLASLSRAGYEPGDYLSIASKDYAGVYRDLHVQPKYRNRVYGRAFPADGPVEWLQYWFFYFYNDSPADQVADPLRPARGRLGDGPSPPR